MPSVGIIKPSTRPGKAEDLVRILPPDIRFEHANCNIDTGTREELERSFADFEGNIDAMLALQVDLIHTAGVPFMLLGRDGEKRLIEGWEDRYGVPFFTNSMSQVDAANAFGVKRIVSASYFRPESNGAFADYLTEAGFDVLENGWIDAPFKDMLTVERPVLRAFFDNLFLPHKGKAEALYLIGPAWRQTLAMTEELEEAYGVPVVSHIPAQSWEIQRRFGIRAPVDGYGRLVRELPV